MIPRRLGRITTPEMIARWKAALAEVRKRNPYGDITDPAAWPLVPEGRRRKLAGGRPAPAGAAPGCHAEWAMPRRGSGEVFFRRPPRRSSAPTRRLGRLGPFLRCPAGARSHSAQLPGAAFAGADLPPANLLRRPSGTGTGRPRTDQVKSPTREWRSQLGRLRLRRSVLQLCKIRARRADFSRSAAGCMAHHAAPRWPRGTRRISTGAGGHSRPLRLVLGGHSRAPSVAAPPLRVPFGGGNCVDAV